MRDRAPNDIATQLIAVRELSASIGKIESFEDKIQVLRTAIGSLLIVPGHTELSAQAIFAFYSQLMRLTASVQKMHSGENSAVAEILKEIEKAMQNRTNTETKQ